MTPVSNVVRSGLRLLFFAALLDGCSGGTLQPSLLPPMQLPAPVRNHKRLQNVKPNGYVYVANRTNRGQSELLVYRAGEQDPSPIRTTTQGLVDVAGVATDSSGNVYVANGAGGNVLEFGPEGASPIFTYSEGLVHPIAIATSGSTLYVADQGNAAYGYAQQVFEYTIGSGTLSNAIAGYQAPPMLNEGIAVDSAGSQGAFFVTASPGTVIPPIPACADQNEFPLGENLFPTLWEDISLTHSTQPSGLAFDSDGKLYVADICSSKVVIYSYVAYTWTYSGDVPGTFSLPLLLTIDNDILAIPSYRGKLAGDPGYVNVIDLSGKTSSMTITRGLQHPVGAAAFY